MLNKKEIKEILKKHGYTMITKSWYVTKDKDAFIFNGYDEICGNPFHFYISLNTEYATKTYLSETSIFESDNISRWFF